MKRVGLIVLISLIGLICRAQEPIEYSVRHYSVSDGLSQNTVMSILQDRDGFMWFGTWDGLNRFDGYDFVTYKPSFYGETLSSNRIDYLYEDSLGYIWMRTYTGAFFRLNKYTGHILPTNIYDLRPDTKRTHEFLLEPRKGEVWIAGGNNLLCISEAEAMEPDRTVETSYTLHGDINALLFREPDCIYAATDKGLECIHNGTSSISAAMEAFNSACFDGKLIWLGTPEGVIWEYSPKTQRFERLEIGLKSPVTAIESLGDLLIATSEDDGFVCYDKRSGQVQLFNSETSDQIGSNCFHDFFIDSHATVWLVNGEAGVLRFQPADTLLKRYLTDIDERYNYQLTRNFFAFEDADGHLWLNTQGGGFAQYNPQTDSLESNLGGVTNMIHAAYMTADETLWLGTYDLGVDRITITPRQFELIDLRQDLQHAGELRAMLQLRDSTLILCTKDKRVRRFSPQLEEMETLPVNAMVYTLVETTDGALWMGAKTDGLFYLTDTSLTQFRHSTQPYSLSCNDVYDLRFGPDSTLYIATFGGGVNILRDGVFLHADNDWEDYPEHFGSKVRCLLFTDDTTLFAGTTTGILRINTRTLQTRTTPYFDIRALHQTADGHLWIGTFGGGLVEVINPLADDLLAAGNMILYTRSVGLTSDIVLSICGDKDLWIAYEDGLTRLQPDTRSFQNFSALKSEKGAVFSEAEPLKLDDGRLLFGCSFGACLFTPEKVFRADDPAPRVTLPSLPDRKHKSQWLGLPVWAWCNILIVLLALSFAIYEVILKQRRSLTALEPANTGFDTKTNTIRAAGLLADDGLEQNPNPNEVFLTHLRDFMERNIDNSDLAVEDLVREMALGRTVFFNRLKTLTGLSPVEFIRDVRIRRAAQLLRDGRYNITEITYMVGLNDSRYFAKCFKSAYGMTPTEYRKNYLSKCETK